MGWGVLVGLSGEGPERAALGEEPVDRAVWKESCQRAAGEACGQRKMESKVPRLGLALKRRKATPLHPGGKEVRGSLNLCSAQQLPRLGLSLMEGDRQLGSYLLAACGTWDEQIDESLLALSVLLGISQV